MSKILVIDDEESLRMLLREALERQGYEVEVAADGCEGTRLFRQRRADLVIVDLFMPKKDGIETIIEIQQACSGVRTIAISGGGLTGAMEFLTHAQALGASRTFAKPFDLEQLLEAVRELVGPGAVSA
jgi:DNA-binding response OmpR family regulator